MIVLIPARGQSKRIPRKNIKALGGKPLIAWTIDAACQLPVKDVVVSTEDEQIADVSLELGATVLLRPADLASDTATDHAVVKHFLGRFPTCNHVVYLRPTTPSRDTSVLKEAIAIVENGYSAAGDTIDSEPWSSLRSVQRMPESAYKCFDMGSEHLLNPIRHGRRNLTNLPNQQCPQTYAANGYIDILSGKLARYGADVFGDCIYGYLTQPTIELDTPEQWAYAEYLIEKGLA
jgi:CMP-N-acetylneuraminic acid synthetase